MPAANNQPAFYGPLAKALRAQGLSIADICPNGDPLARRILHDYGAMFVADSVVSPPPTCVFKSEAEVSAFQDQAGYQPGNFEGATVELQPTAMAALLKAAEAARGQDLSITPRDGAEAARRSYADTVRLWNSRFEPALKHWTGLGRLTAEQAELLRILPTSRQVIEVLELEKHGIFFSKDFSKSILYSIAAPGTSQHIAMLAFDANEFLNESVRRIMADHGWFQTVLSDLPHFTYLGLPESELPGRGLKTVTVHGQKFWIPDV
jgi:hypothetical protein